jgi:DNA-binding response OmpR family regulator
MSGLRRVVFRTRLSSTGGCGNLSANIHSSVRILAIDDDQTLLEFYQEFLSEEGHEVRIARHGAEGLALLGGWRPELILLDLEMPVLSGEEFLERLDQRDPSLPVLVLSGSTRRLSALVGRRGGTAYLRKPFVFKDLRDFVRRAASQTSGGQPADPAEIEE